jgi:hypothetical protein
VDVALAIHSNKSRGTSAFSLHRTQSETGASRMPRVRPSVKNVHRAFPGDSGDPFPLTEQDTRFETCSVQIL